VVQVLEAEGVLGEGQLAVLDEDAMGRLELLPLSKKVQVRPGKDAPALGLQVAQRPLPAAVGHNIILEYIKFVNIMILVPDNLDQTSQTIQPSLIQVQRDPAEGGLELVGGGVVRGQG
jgi:hypothetical protein